LDVGLGSEHLYFSGNGWGRSALGGLR
jgi:hypothetical protein